MQILPSEMIQYQTMGRICQHILIDIKTTIRTQEILATVTTNTHTIITTEHLEVGIVMVPINVRNLLHTKHKILIRETKEGHPGGPQDDQRSKTGPRDIKNIRKYRK